MRLPQDIDPKDRLPTAADANDSGQRGVAQGAQPSAETKLPAVDVPCSRDSDSIPGLDSDPALVLRLLADQGPDWEYWVGPDGGYRYVSPACEAICGYPPEAFLADPGLFRKLVHPHDRARWDRHWTDPTRPAAGGAGIADESLELRLRARDGGERWIEHRGWRVRDAAGRDLGRRGANRDIGRRKATEEALVRSEANLKALVQATPVGIGTVRDRVYVEVNDRLCEMLGYPRESLLGQSTRIVFPSDAEHRRVGETLYPLLLRDGVASLDIRLRRRDGEVIVALLTSAPLDRADLSRGVVSTLLDVTQARRDQALLEAELELSAAAAGGELEALLRASLAAAERLTQSRIGFLHLFGPDGERLSLQSWSAATLAAGCVAFESGGHAPLSRAGVWAEAVRQGVPVVHNDYEALNRGSKLPEGHVPLERELVVPVVRGGAPMAVIGVGNKPEPYTDSDRDALTRIVSLTMAKVEGLRAQQALRQHARVFESTSEGVVITDAQGRILAVNRSFISITGYSESEVLGQNPRMFSSGRHDREFYRQMWDALAASGQWRGEIWNRRKNGEVYPEWLTISAVIEPDGQTSHYVAVFSDISQIKRTQERLDFLAHHDALTGLPNRLLCQDRLDRAVRSARREGKQVALLFLDLDGFKDVNDTLGHAAGDRLLQVVSDRLVKRLRDSDTLARLGGDEFLIVLQGDTGAADAAAAADACLHLLAQPVRIRGHEIYLSGSIGISLFPGDGEDPETLLASADLAMYRAKSEGRNTYQFYVPEMTARAVERQQMENALRGALKRGELEVHYQAQVELAEGRLCGVEALARWVHPSLGTIQPGRFVSIAEGIGVVAEIDEWVLAEACRQLADWRASGFGVARVAVNCSRQSLERGTLVPAVRRVLEGSSLPPGDLELEITESAIMQNRPRVLAALGDLHALGVRLAVDDFGTGHSALGRLNRIPIDRIKIDASFIRDIGRDAKAEAVARALAGLGQDLGLEVLAEGVERVDQVQLLLSEGCRYAQGYLFGPPMDPAALRAVWGPGGGPIRPA
jgi:diguanylate cyclase (GGDEF)-like protein/PAS domain S-box-containing protein